MMQTRFLPFLLTSKSIPMEIFAVIGHKKMHFLGIKFCVQDNKNDRLFLDLLAMNNYALYNVK
jgi:hypothetical protein